MFDDVIKKLLSEVADLTEVPEDAVYTTARKEQSSPLATKQECLQEIPDGAPQAP